MARKTKTKAGDTKIEVLLKADPPRDVRCVAPNHPDAQHPDKVLGYTVCVAKASPLYRNVPMWVGEHNFKTLAEAEAKVLELRGAPPKRRDAEVERLQQELDAEIERNPALIKIYRLLRGYSLHRTARVKGGKVYAASLLEAAMRLVDQVASDEPVPSEVPLWSISEDDLNAKDRRFANYVLESVDDISEVTPDWLLDTALRLYAEKCYYEDQLSAQRERPVPPEEAPKDPTPEPQPEPQPPGRGRHFKSYVPASVWTQICAMRRELDLSNDGLLKKLIDEEWQREPPTTMPRRRVPHRAHHYGCYPAGETWAKIRALCERYRIDNTDLVCFLVERAQPPHV